MSTAAGFTLFQVRTLHPRTGIHPVPNPEHDNDGSVAHPR